MSGKKITPKTYSLEIEMSGKKITPTMIYKALRDMFPGEYVPLRKVPTECPHPGNEPKKSPSYQSKTIYSKTIIKADMSVQQMMDLLSEVPTRSFTVSPKRVQIGTEKKSYQEYQWDGEDDVEVTVNTEVPVYSDEVEFVEFYTSYEDPEWGSLVSQAKKDNDLWHDRMRNYSRKRKDRDAAMKHNRSLISAARHHDSEKWAGVGRLLKGKADPNFIAKQRDRLLTQVDRLNALIAEEED